MIPKEIIALCDRVSHVTYENLTKILHYARGGSADRAQKLDDSHQNDLDYWMGGGTCFSLTWHLYQELQAMGYYPRLLMGHKRKDRNVHCALWVRIDSDCHTALVPTTLFLDPGYLIFDPLPVPEVMQRNYFPLRPNVAELRRTSTNVLELWTGSVGQPLKLRFEFPCSGVDEAEFHQHWRASFHFEMMQYPVLNRLDRAQGIQYYFQKGNLVVRSEQGSTLHKIAPEDQVRVLSETFQLAPELVQDAMGVLRKLL
jgi:arylamine N-acetyltransferase